MFLDVFIDGISQEFLEDLRQYTTMGFENANVRDFTVETGKHRDLTKTMVICLRKIGQQNCMEMFLLGCWKSTDLKWINLGKPTDCGREIPRQGQL